MKSKTFFNVLLVILLCCFGVNAEIVNEKGDFTVTIDSLKKQTFNDDIQTEYLLNIENNKNYKQKFTISAQDVKGWDINLNPDLFSLESGEDVDVILKFESNSEFDYGTDLTSHDTILISRKDTYIGSTEFPVEIAGEEQNVNLNLKLDIKAKEKKNEEYIVEFSTKAVSPINSLNFAVKGENIESAQKVKITLKFAGEEFVFNDIFDSRNNYHIYEQKIPATIKPGIYDAKVVVRLEKEETGLALEWNAIKQIDVIPYNKVDETIENNKNLFLDKTQIKLVNLGNQKETYNKTIKSNWFKNLFLSSNINYTQGEQEIVFSTDLNQGEIKNINYVYNYIPLYIVTILVIIVGGYIFFRVNANPLDVEVNLYEVKKVKYEGVKQLKVKIGFENIKEQELDNLSIIFRMPKYLNVKDNSFLLTPPTHVLKGRNQYKLSWDFKRFEKDESRILGFTLVNARGILGDIKIPDLEIEIKNKGKIKKYHKSVPLIKG